MMIVYGHHALSTGHGRPRAAAGKLGKRLRVECGLSPDSARLARAAKIPAEAAGAVLTRLQRTMDAARHVPQHLWAARPGPVNLQPTPAPGASPVSLRETVPEVLPADRAGGAAAGARAQRQYGEDTLNSDVQQVRVHVHQRRLLLQLQRAPYLASIPHLDLDLSEQLVVSETTTALPNTVHQASEPSAQLGGTLNWQQQLLQAAPVAAALITAAAAVGAHQAAGNTSTGARSISHAQFHPAAVDVSWQTQLHTLESTAAAWPSRMAAATTLLLHCATQQQQARMAQWDGSSSISGSDQAVDEAALHTLDTIYTLGCALATLGNAQELLCMHSGSGLGSSSAGQLVWVLDYCHLLDTYMAQHERQLDPLFLQQLPSMSLQAKGQLASGQLANRRLVFSAVSQQLLADLTAQRERGSGAVPLPTAATPAAATAQGPFPSPAWPASRMPPIAIHINTTSIATPDISVNPINTNHVAAHTTNSTQVSSSATAAAQAAASQVAPASPNLLTAVAGLLGMLVGGAWGSLRLVGTVARLVKGLVAKGAMLYGLLHLSRAPRLAHSKEVGPGVAVPTS